MRNLLLIAQLLFVSGFTFGQGGSSPTTIHGEVLDEFSQLPVSLATVHIRQNKLTWTAITSASGEFEVTVSSINLDLIISIEHISYEGKILTVKPLEAPFRIFIKPSTEHLESAIITAIRSNQDHPATTTDLKKADIQARNYGQDLPILLGLTPSTVVSSDAGAGVGYTGIRIRGIDPTRVNVTINGIPLNDAESHGVYWVDLPDLASSVNSIQIQRGVGTSTNGTASFGSSINIKTDHVAAKPFASAEVAAGSFATYKANFQFGTGVLSSGWGMQGRVSAITSEGFIDRASSDLKSLFLTAAKYGKKDLIKINFMAGHERTYQAWYGVPQPWFENKLVETESFMKELYFSPEERDHLLGSGQTTYNPYTYKDEVDNYDQHHFQVFYNRKLSTKLRLNTGLHYTHGYGYFEQYRSEEDFDVYGLVPLFFGSDTVSSGDFIRRRWLDNHFYGAIFSVERVLQRGSLVIGGGIHQYDGGHFGELIWAEYASNSQPGDLYYEYEADKSEANLYSKYTRNITSNLTGYLDLQVRSVVYSYEHPDLPLNGNKKKSDLTFFNPKVGVVYKGLKNHQSRILLAMSNREPVRDDFVNSSPNYQPRAERLYNLEMGDEWKREKWAFSLNYYLMYYQDQLVLTGEINDVGAYIRTNVPESYRMGIEVESGWTITKRINIAANLTLSQNKIISFTEYVDDWNTGVQQQFERSNSTLAFSPGYVAMIAIQSELSKGLKANINYKAVGKQYLDNSESDKRALSSFSVFNLQADYSFTFKDNSHWSLGLQINNLLDVSYAPNGYTFGAMDANIRKSYNYVYPMAGRHALLRITIEV